VYNYAKTGRILNLWSMTKKGHQKFLRMKMTNFVGQREFCCWKWSLV